MSILGLGRTDVSGMTVSEAAAHWLILHDAERISAHEKEAFQRWLDASTAHREAYEQARSLWSGFDEYADQAELRALRTVALGVEPQSRRWKIIAVSAACCLAAVVVIGVIRPRENASDGLTAASSTLPQEKYSTARNERSIVTLSDGTVATLNLDTALSVAFTASERTVRIVHGQAFFEVAKNPHRPFVVLAADRRVTALGTQFDVRLDPDRVEVILLEGKVSVDHTSPSLIEELNLRKAHVELHPGQKLVAALGEPMAVSETNAQRATSWRQGWIVFENESVGDAVAELNRYSEPALIVPDEAVRNLRLSGVFRVGQPDRFASIIQELLPVRAVKGAHGETLLLANPPRETQR